MSHVSLWNGTQGEWYVVAQVVLLGLVFFGPSRLEGWPKWADPVAIFASIVGGILFLMGGLLVISGGLQLGVSLTAVPFPKDQGTLRETGPYRLVRHPMYSGGVMIALGSALWARDWLSVGYAIALFLFVDVKARREEQWLKDKFADYGAYQRRESKPIPCLN